MAIPTANKPKGRNKNLGVAQCPQCGEKIRLSRKAFENCKPICGACVLDFEMADSEMFSETFVLLSCNPANRLRGVNRHASSRPVGVR